MRLVKKRLGKAFQRRRARERAAGSETDSDKSVAASSRTVARLTWVLAATAALSAVATSLQWWEIHSGGEDTHTLAVASGKQAAAAEQQLGVMQRQLEQTDKLINASETQAENAKRSVSVARDSVVAAQRAWVGPTTSSIAGTVAIGSPVTVKIGITNSGREPATKFSYAVENHIFLDGTPMSTEALEAYSSYVRSHSHRCLLTPTGLQSQVLFPSTGFAAGGVEISNTIPASAVDQNLVEGKSTLIIRGCLTYQTSGLDKHTSFCFFYRSGVSEINRLSICQSGWDAD